MEYIYTLYFDGKSEPNPGKGSGAAILYNNNTVLFNIGKYLENTTNNQAEYIGLIIGLSKCIQLGIHNLVVKGDSKLVINQSLGIWKTKDSKLIPLNELINIFKKRFNSIDFIHIKRELNKDADALTNTIYEKKEHLNYIEDSEKITSIPSKMDIRDMFGIRNIKKYELNEEQKAVLDEIKEKKNIFVTGPGGTGKSFLINHIRNELENQNKKVAITSLTGMAALLIGNGARTIHSWSGLGIGNRSIDDYYSFIKIKHKKAREAWRTVDVLIIDEISMMSDTFFEKLNEIGKLLRNSDKLFGGIQLLCFGDFYQLPPINTKFIFESSLWNESIDTIVILDKIYRQKDPIFQNMLNEIRVGKVSDETDRLLKSRLGLDFTKEEIQPTKIFSRRDIVDKINKESLAKIETEEKIYKIFTKGKVCSDSIKNSLTRMDNSAQYEKELVLKVGAQVMLIANIDQEKGLVNGRLGIVKELKYNSVVVHFKNENENENIEINIYQWPLEDNETITQNQIPLILAYAITTHKCQGSTLDSAYIDIGSSIFEHGQAYVALSRVKSLDTLYLYEYSRKAIKAHPKVVEYYETLL